MRYLNKVRHQAPLVHSITNQVVMNFQANGLYAIGASPIMAHETEEMADITKLAHALVLNIGTLTKDIVKAMLIAGKEANKKGIPIVLDPVGVGASTYRLDVVTTLMKKLNIQLVRGNKAEIMTLVSLKQAGKGVEGDMKADAYELAKAFYERYNAIVVITGKEDVLYNGEKVYRLNKGTPLLTQVTGTGCLLTAVIAAFLAVAEPKEYMDAAKEAVDYYTSRSEEAAKKSSLPGSFSMHFIDSLASFGEDSESVRRTEEVKP